MHKARLHCGIEGRFHIIQKDKSGRVKFESEFKNLIVNEGLNEVATRNFNSAAGDCLLLTDNTPPEATETAQDTNWSYRSSNTVSTYSAGGPDHRARVRQVFDFPPSGGNYNFSSVATGYYTSTAGNRRLFSRALILDGSNQPTTISVLEGDYVQVTYDIYLYPSLSDVTGTIVFTGDIGGTYDYIVRLCNVDTYVSSIANTLGTSPSQSFNTTIASGGNFSNHTICFTGDIGPIDGTPFGSSNNTATDTSSTYLTYVEDSFTIRRRWRRGLRSNPINIRCATHRFGPFSYQTQFDPPIPKTTTDVLDLTYEVSWARR